MEKLLCVFPEICEGGASLPEDIELRVQWYERHLKQPVIINFEELPELSESYLPCFEKILHCKDPDMKLRIIRYELPWVCYSSTLWSQDFGTDEEEKVRNYNGIVAIEVVKEHETEYMVFTISSFDFILYAGESADRKNILTLVRTNCPTPSMHQNYIRALKDIYRQAGLSVRESDIGYSTTVPICYGKGAYINYDSSLFKLNYDDTKLSSDYEIR